MNALPSYVTGSASIFDKDRNRPVADPPDFLRAMRRRLGLPIVNRGQGFRTYTFPHNVFDRATVTVWRVRK